MANETFEGDRRFNFTATNTAVQNGTLLGIFVASSTSGTIKVADAAGTIINTTAVVAATFYRIPCKFQGGLVITVGGTLDATAFYKL